MLLLRLLHHSSSHHPTRQPTPPASASNAAKLNASAAHLEAPHHELVTVFSARTTHKAACEGF